MMGDLLTSDVGIAAIAALGVGVISLIIAIILAISLSKAKRSYKRLTMGNDHANIEQLMLEIRDRFDAVQTEQALQKKTMDYITQQIKKMKSRVGVHRYNAFDAEGNDLSFSIAMLDEEANGVVLSGIHSREQTYVYAKPIEKGQSKYNLSPEEKEAITRISR